MHRIVVNVQTGEQEIVPLTVEEIAELESRPQPEPIPVPVLTTEQKLEAAGLSVAELRKLFGLPEPEATVLVRARNEDGTFVADDPSTPENEAYVEVPLSQA